MFCAATGTAIAEEPKEEVFSSPTPVERGKAALEQTAFIKAFWPKSAHDNAWRVWGLKQKPTDYASAFRNRYGLQPAPYPNDGLPMGLRSADMLIGKGIGIDCMTCHGGSLFGKSIIGLGNSSLDIQALFEELAAAGGSPFKTAFAFTQVRGTTEAGAFAVYLLGMRRPDLSLAKEIRDLGLHDDSCEDVPAWWLLKKKSTMYHVGSTDARSVRSIMQFMMHPLTTPKEFTQAESTFKDIREYLQTIEAPKYPFPIDPKKAARGKNIFNGHCASCHGTYGEIPSYPDKVIPLKNIGTDPKRFENIGKPFAEAYNASWFAQESTGRWYLPGRPLRETTGYQAPPLDGIWATAPYFHNGSVPTLAGVLESTNRPDIYTRTFLTREEDYDPVHVGWKVTQVKRPDNTLPAIERRRVYDTSLPGRGNSGHIYGDALTAEERFALIEYLKTL